jgi:ribosomal protein S18 acetylase RimI-like enzyme
MNTNIRRASEKDIPAMVEMLGELFSVEKDFSGDKEKQEAGLCLILKDIHKCVLVAEADGEVVGMVTAQMLISTAEGGYSALIEDMVVKKKFRRMRIGKKLLDSIEKWAFLNEAKRVVLQADKDNQPALEFYAKQNWKSTNLISYHKFFNSPLS